MPLRATALSSIGTESRKKLKSKGYLRREVEGVCGQGSESKREREGRGGPSLRTVWRRPLDRTPSTGSGGQDKKRSIKEDVGRNEEKKRGEGGGRAAAVNNGVWDLSLIHI